MRVQRGNWPRVAAVVACIWLLGAGSAEAAAFTQQGGKLVGSPPAAGSGAGASTALSDDGSTALVGAPGLGGPGYSSPGGAYVFVRSGIAWAQQGPALVASGDTGLGSAVALSADGNTALVGGSHGAFVYTRTGGTWAPQGAELVGSGAASNISVALSADGNTALVGESGVNNWTGAAYVFVRSGSTWSEQGQPLVADCTSACSGPNGTGEAGAGLFGAGVALSGDGDTALIGGPGDGGPFANAIGPGAAWIFTRSGSTWSQEGQKLRGTGATSSDSGQGNGVALSRDGSTALINANGEDAVWVFTDTASGWTQQTKLAGSNELYGDPAGEVALSDSGDLALIGGTQGGLVYARSGATWGPATTLTGSGAAGSAQQGSSVALAGDGSTALLGGPNDNSGTGAAWVFASGPPPAVSLSVTLAGAGTGTVTGGPINCPGTCAASLPAGSAVTLVAAPRPGSMFAGWSGACTGAGPCSLTVDQATSATATFSSVPVSVSPVRCTLSVPTHRVQMPAARRLRAQPARRRAGILGAAVVCDGAARVTVTGAITAAQRRRGGWLRTTRFTAGPVRATMAPGTRRVLSLPLPRGALAALAAGARESVALSLVATSDDGTSRATARVGALGYSVLPRAIARRSIALL